MEGACGLYMLSLYVDKVVLVNAADDGRKSVRLQANFWGLPSINIVPKTPTSQHCEKSEPNVFKHFEIGSSGYFYSKTVDLIRSIQRHPILITVYQSLDESFKVVGSCKIKVTDRFSELISRAATTVKKHAVSGVIKGVYNVVNRGHIQVGTVSMQIRLICYDSSLLKSPYRPSDVPSESTTDAKYLLPKKTADGFVFVPTEANQGSKLKDSLPETDISSQRGSPVQTHLPVWRAASLNAPPEALLPIDISNLIIDTTLSERTFNAELSIDSFLSRNHRDSKSEGKAYFSPQRRRTCDEQPSITGVFAPDIEKTSRNEDPSPHRKMTIETYISDKVLAEFTGDSRGRLVPSGGERSSAESASHVQCYLSPVKIFSNKGSVESSRQPSPPQNAVLFLSSAGTPFHMDKNISAVKTDTKNQAPAKIPYCVMKSASHGEKFVEIMASVAERPAENTAKSRSGTGYNTPKIFDPMGPDYTPQETKKVEKHEETFGKTSVTSFMFEKQRSESSIPEISWKELPQREERVASIQSYQQLSLPIPAVEEKTENEIYTSKHMERTISKVLVPTIQYETGEGREMQSLRNPKQPIPSKVHPTHQHYSQSNTDQKSVSKKSSNYSLTGMTGTIARSASNTHVIDKVSSQCSKSDETIPSRLPSQDCVEKLKTAEIQSDQHTIRSIGFEHPALKETLVANNVRQQFPKCYLSKEPPCNLLSEHGKSPEKHQRLPYFQTKTTAEKEVSVGSYKHAEHNTTDDSITVQSRSAGDEEELSYISQADFSAGQLTSALNSFASGAEREPTGLTRHRSPEKEQDIKKLKPLRCNSPEDRWPEKQTTRCQSAIHLGGTNGFVQESSQHHTYDSDFQMQLRDRNRKKQCGEAVLHKQHQTTAAKTGHICDRYGIQFPPAFGQTTVYRYMSTSQCPTGFTFSSQNQTEPKRKMEESHMEPFPQYSQSEINHSLESNVNPLPSKYPPHQNESIRTPEKEFSFTQDRTSSEKYEKEFLCYQKQQESDYSNGKPYSESCDWEETLKTLDPHFQPSSVARTAQEQHKTTYFHCGAQFGKPSEESSTIDSPDHDDMRNTIKASRSPYPQNRSPDPMSKQKSPKKTFSHYKIGNRPIQPGFPSNRSTEQTNLDCTKSDDDWYDQKGTKLGKIQRTWDETTKLGRIPYQNSFYPRPYQSADHQAPSPNMVSGAHFQENKNIHHHHPYSKTVADSLGYKADPHNACSCLTNFQKPWKERCNSPRHLTCNISNISFDDPNRTSDGWSSEPECNQADCRSRNIAMPHCAIRPTTSPDCTATSYFKHHGPGHLYCTGVHSYCHDCQSEVQTHNGWNHVCQNDCRHA